MKKYTFILVSIFLFLHISCKDTHIDQKNSETIEAWTPAYTKLDVPVHLDERTRIAFCYQYDEISRSNQEKDRAKRFFNQIYPKYYGGMYIPKEDPMKTIVLLTDTSAITKQEFIKLCQIKSSDVIFKPCTHSYNELILVFKHLYDMPNLSETWGIESVGINTENNKVNIYFKGSIDHDKVKRFEATVFHSPLLAFTFCNEEKIGIESNEKKIKKEKPSIY